MVEDLNPKISVLMPVYNGERYLKQAIDSILSQTFRDFEFLIINDGSTDATVEIITSYTDTRIRLIHNDTNLGLIATLNRGLDLAYGEYIARMDCDDISLPKRLAKQVSFMDRNSDVGICGTWIQFIGSNRIKKYPLTHEAIKCNLLFDSSMAHPSVMIRKGMLIKHNLYYEINYQDAEDYKLWTRCVDVFKLANIPEVLVKYRLHVDQASKRNEHIQFKTRFQIHAEYLSLLYSINPENKDSVNKLLFLSYYVPSIDMLVQGHELLCRLYYENRRKLIFSEHEFNALLAERWFELCNASSSLGYSVWLHYLRSELRQASNLSLKQELKLLLKCLLRFNLTR
jgi:glycosyltransferase involved in cell wall biosynthesis